jgi:hypothetical protein
MLAYDKGEKRYKHEWAGTEPTIQFDGRNPRKWIGKCPSGMNVELRTQLLNEAIPAPPGDREINYAKYVYVVHEGAIYEGRTSDHGQSYHGFPYRGKLSVSLLEGLREMAKAKNCLRQFEDWIKKHIERVGEAK